MVSRVKAFIFSGINPIQVEVQVHISPGLPNMNIVGLADKSINESKDRIKAAFNSLGLSLPAKKIIVNLTPANIYKEGSHFDLAIACAILVEIGLIDQNTIDKYVALGELGLDGKILPVAGILASAYNCVTISKGLICSPKSAHEASWISGIPILCPDNLIDLLNHFKGISIIPYTVKNKESLSYEVQNTIDMVEIKGQESGKRAVEITATGGHNLLMIGPPGAGKSMLAKSIIGILPDLGAKEILDVSIIKSLAGEILAGEKIMKHKPFRAPHHASSNIAIIGGGSKANVGEISFAHKGILFLDEFPEFSRDVIEALRQPIETKEINISRARYKVTYPADFQLIAAMNPCKCGYFYDNKKSCTKKPLCGMQYRSKISGPILDRIDLQVEIPAISLEDIKKHNKHSAESSNQIRKRVLKAQDFQKERYKQYKTSIELNAYADGKILEETVNTTDKAMELLHKALDKLGLSMRAYHRILRVARTIADLELGEKVQEEHILEAISYRNIL